MLLFKANIALLSLICRIFANFLLRNTMIRSLTILYVFFLLLPSALSAQTKLALIIGFGIQEDANWPKINGDNDVAYVQQMLKRVGYTDVRTLINGQATKVGIISAFGEITNACNVGDMVYIHFSGHGQQMTDISGDEDDGWDEAWIPYDAYRKFDPQRDKGEKHLVDDEINFLLMAIRNKIGSIGAMLVVVDACHSGDSTRGDDEEETIRGIKDEFVIPGNQISKGVNLTEQWLTLSACKDYQLNQEMKNPKVGKLTYALYSISEKGSVTMEEIHQFMQRNRGHYVQTPVLTGETSTHNLSDFIR